MEQLNDAKVQKIINSEVERQQNELEMIASENYISKDVMMAQSNAFTNKYSEGYPKKRYYGGQKHVDEIERLAQYRALRIFGLIDSINENDDNFVENFESQLKDNEWGVNVQPLSGSPANLAVYTGVLNPGDKILSMDLNAGGHLSHGHQMNTSGIFYEILHYGVNKNTLEIDFDEITEKALEYKPKLILAGYSSYPRDIDWSKYKEIADKIEQQHGYRPLLMADIAHIAGLIAGEQMNSPFPYFDIVTTTTHKTLRGPRGALIYYRKDERELTKKINRGVFPGVQGGPHEHIIAAKAVSFGEILSSDRNSYAQKVIENARTLAEKLKNLGWNVMTGGTDNHTVLLDVTQKGEDETGISGKTAEKVLEDIGVSVNKNLLPGDERNPMDPSGLRLGTPALTTRGLGKEDIEKIAELMDQALTNTDNTENIEKLKKEVGEICQKFPLKY